ncbi:hypothetical protein MMC07_008978, partial [Pseudocyphellaria aurata]|nr:hypothetical protein [Pseudocyphellaria aurata]
MAQAERQLQAGPGAAQFSAEPYELSISDLPAVGPTYQQQMRFLSAGSLKATSAAVRTFAAHSGRYRFKAWPCTACAWTTSPRAHHAEQEEAGTTTLCFAARRQDGALSPMRNTPSLSRGRLSSVIRGCIKFGHVPAFRHAAPHARVNVGVDPGMHRPGICIARLRQLGQERRIYALQQLQKLPPAGVSVSVNHVRQLHEDRPRHPVSDTECFFYAHAWADEVQ